MLVDAWILLKTLDLTQETPAKQVEHPIGLSLTGRDIRRAWVVSSHDLVELRFHREPGVLGPASAATTVLDSHCRTGSR